MTATLSFAAEFSFAGMAFLGAGADELRGVAGEIAFLPEELVAALDADPEELRREYVRLFLSPTGAPCAPWQSVHGDEPALMGPTHASALSWFRAHGFEPCSPWEPADHAGLLLLFSGRLLQTSHAEFGRFRQEHLEWIKDFCGSVRLQARAGFYRELAAWTELLILEVR